MANKGLQFEWAILYEAKRRLNTSEMSVGDKTLLQQAKAKRGNDKAVLNAASKMTKHIEGLISGSKVATWKSFSKTSGGGAEPKTDILFKIGSKKYKCSMKYGTSVQLASGGITSSVSYLKSVTKSLKETKGITNKSSQELLSIFAELDATYNVGTKKQPEIKRMLNVVRNEGGLQDRLQRALGSGTSPDPAEEFEAFKRAVVLESMTGRATFGPRNDKTANYILSDTKLIPITMAYVNQVTAKASVRIRAKGRGKKEGIRYNEIVISMDSTL
tara:strand:+ start:9653 stop:10471 length:819 start_codon:yes stop_codon:yes gene_type:complete